MAPASHATSARLAIRRSRPPREQHEAQARERGPQPRGELCRAGDQVRGSSQPVVEHRLLPPIFVVEMRREPVARLDHLARRLSVERFVGVGDGLAAEPEKEREEREKEQPQNRTSHGRHRTRSAIVQVDNERMAKTVAVVGASSDRNKFGNKALRAFQAEGHTVIPINPNEREVEGLKTYASVLDVPGAIDMATVYVQPRGGAAAPRGIRAEEDPGDLDQPGRRERRPRRRSEAPPA